MSKLVFTFILAMLLVCLVSAKRYQGGHNKNKDVTEDEHDVSGIPPGLANKESKNKFHKEHPGNGNQLSKGDDHPSNNKYKNRKRRVSEKKYTEYIKRIFPDDDDTASDADDTDFNGRTLAEPGEYPHMAALGFRAFDGSYVFKCGGSLISEDFVITAAHCTDITGQKPSRVRIGDLNLKIEEHYLEPQVRDIETIVNHPNYTHNSHYNDIALLKLNESVDFTEFVRPIRLWVYDEIPYKTAYAMGYGSTAFAQVSTNRLTDLNMTIVSNEECDRQLPELPEAEQGIIDSQLCAQDFELNRDTCQGDSGGPLQLTLYGRRKHQRKHYHLIGITSYGLICRGGHPGVYTRLSAFLDWIESVVWPAEWALDSR